MTADGRGFCVQLSSDFLPRVEVEVEVYGADFASHCHNFAKINHSSYTRNVALVKRSISLKDIDFISFSRVKKYLYLRLFANSFPPDLRLSTT